MHVGDSWKDAGRNDKHCAVGTGGVRNLLDRAGKVTLAVEASNNGPGNGVGGHRSGDRNAE
jgi:hypothetical protein